MPKNTDKQRWADQEEEEEVQVSIEINMEQHSRDNHTPKYRSRPPTMVFRKELRIPPMPKDKR